MNLFYSVQFRMKCCLSWRYCFLFHHLCQILFLFNLWYVLKYLHAYNNHSSIHHQYPMIIPICHLFIHSLSHFQEIDTLSLKTLNQNVYQQFSPALFLQGLSLLHAHFSNRAYLSFAFKYLTSSSFHHLSLTTSKHRLGNYPQFQEYMHSNQEKTLEFVKECCNTWKDQSIARTKALVLQMAGWTYLTSTFVTSQQASSLAYLATCTYTVTDPHLSSDGMRRKTMRIPPPSITYQNAAMSQASQSSKAAQSPREGETEDSEKEENVHELSYSYSMSSGLREKEMETKAKSSQSLLASLRRLGKNTQE